MLLPWDARLRLWLIENIVAERDRWFPWAVVAFAAGSLCYFALKTEPSVYFAGSIFSAGMAFGFVAARASTPEKRFFCTLLVACCFGFSAAKLRTEWVSAPVVSSDIGPLRMQGRIESVFVEDTNRARILFAPSTMGRETADLPRRLRLSLRGESAVAAVAPGMQVSLLAMVRPPPEPASPGGYDFARWAFFSGIGGVGFVLGTPEQLQADWSPNSRQQFGAAIERVRRAMSTRIQNVLEGSDGAIAAALITGERAAIPEEDNNAYRDSGLFHVLSISGVHMALAGLGIFWIVRAILALFPSLALNHPIKKWAALAAILGATFYVFISGASAPAVRSYIMLVVMLVGVLADRPALSMRSVAIAAILLLLFEPEGVIEPSFQMSFSAIIGLIALAEWHRALPNNDGIAKTGAGDLYRWVRRYVVGLIFASIVAGLATAPFAIYHFDRAPGYSLLANLLACPVVGTIIMPSACLSVALMPFGLEYWPLQAMGWGVGIMTAIAHWVADLPGAVRLVPAKSEVVLLLVVAGGLWMGLWQRLWRWYGLVAISAGFVLGAVEKPPDILVSRDGDAAAVRGPDGALVLIGNPDQYTAEQWLLRDGDERNVEAAKEGALCDEWGCAVVDREGNLIALALKAGSLADDCERAQILISAVPIRRNCAGPIFTLDLFDVFYDGATALYFTENGIAKLTTSDRRGDRPWSQKRP
jgi:competence protein ComEC